MVRHLGGDAQGGGAAQEKLFEIGLHDVPGQVDEEFSVVAGAGDGAAVAPLAAQDEIVGRHIGLHFLGQLDFAQVGQRLGAVGVAMTAVDQVDDRLLDGQRQAADGEILFQFHIGRDLGLQVLRTQHRPFLHFRKPDQLLQRKIAAADIDTQIHIGGEIAYRTASVVGAEVHGDAHFDDAGLPGIPVAAVHLLEGIQHQAGQEFRHRAVQPEADLLHGVHRQDGPDIPETGCRKPLPFEVVSRDILFQFPFPTREDGLETVLDLAGVRDVGRVQDVAAIGDGDSVLQTEVLPCQGDQEGLGARPVGQGMENVQDDSVAVSAYLIEKTAVVAEMETVQGGRRRNLGVLVHPAQVPPEGAGLQFAPEGGQPVGHRDQRILQDDRVHRFRQRHAHPVQGCIMLAQGGGIDVRRVVDPHPGGYGKNLCHKPLLLIRHENRNSPFRRQEKVAKGGKM